MLGASGSWVAFTELVPFLMVFGFLTFAVRNARARVQSGQEPYLEKLEEIRAELERLRRTLEKRDDSGFGFRP